jgi:hypothetical protein
MVGPVSRGRTRRVDIFLAIILGVRSASAHDANVGVHCIELSAEDTAEVEARVRASLLGTGAEPATVELSCERDAAQTEVSGSGRQLVRRRERGAISAKEALLASAEAALSAWSAEISAAESPRTAAPAVMGVPAAEPAQPAVAATVTRAPKPPSAPPSARPSTPALRTSTWLSAGPRAELWRDAWALGPQVGVEQRLNAGFLGISGGYLLNLPRSTRFSAHDLHFGAQIGWQPSSLFGFRGALGIGLSLFGVSPDAGVSAPSGTTNSTLASLNAELSRPVEFGALALVPTAGFRLFLHTRSVFIDDQEVLALPPLVLGASVSLALKVGG